MNGPNEKPVLLTFMYLKRVDPTNRMGVEYECFVGTTIPNDPLLNPATTTTFLLTEAGTGNKCSRLADPYKSGMKLIGANIAEGNMFVDVQGRVKLKKFVRFTRTNKFKAYVVGTIAL